MVFANSEIQNGNAFAFVVGVGGNSTAADVVRGQDVEEDEEQENDLLEKHFNLTMILIVLLTVASIILFLQCGIKKTVTWTDSANIALMMFVYGFPYILAIPSIWDKAVKQVSNHLAEGNVLVKNLDAVE